MAYDKLSLSLQDSYGRQTTKIIECPEYSTRAEAISAATAFATLLNAVTDLQLVRCDLICTAIATGFAGAAGSNVDVGGTVSGLVTDGNGKKASLKIPGIIAAAVNPDGTLDLENAALDAYLDQFLAAGGFYLSDGESIASWIKGVLDK